MLWPIMLFAMTEAQIETAIAQAPANIRALVERRQGCNHWAGEEPYDKDRERQIRAAMRQLRCARLNRDDAAIRRKYHGRNDLIGLIDETEERGY